MNTCTIPLTLTFADRVAMNMDLHVSPLENIKCFVHMCTIV